MNEKFYSLFDWLSMWSLPLEPLDPDVAFDLMSRKFEALCEDADWCRYAIGKWPDEVFDLAPDWMLMMQQIEHFQDQGVTASEMAKYPTQRVATPTRIAGKSPELFGLVEAELRDATT
jgi:hypothetical protein